MPKNLTSAILALVIVTLGCANCIPGWMDAKKSADQLMTALRDGDYARARELMDNDGSKPSAKSIEDLKKKIEAGNLQPQSWTLAEQYVSNKAGSSSYSIITGNVVFKDGTNGTLRIEARAFGARQNPWRFSGLELKR
jgi:anti-sigma28 factor (negative regulator of flagellin synthesis)